MHASTPFHRSQAGGPLPAGPDARSARSLIGAAAAALAPFAAGRLAGTLLIGDGAATGSHVWCPFRAVTGLPCPLCGATRSVVLASRGDLTFLTYNPFWVAVLLAVALGALAALVLRARPRLAPGIAWQPLVVSGLAAGWACALLHRHAITAT